MLLLLVPALLQSIAPAAAAPLQGGVEHSESLPPVDPSLQSGADFDDREFQNVVPNNLWVPIPSWFAGVWQTRSETQLETLDLVSGVKNTKPRSMTRADRWIFGMQMDNSGQIWHFINVPSSRKVVVADLIEYRQELSKEFLYSGEDKVISRYRFTAVQVDAASNKIKRVHQQESVMQFMPPYDDAMEVDSSLKGFNTSGRPQLQAHHITVFFRAQAFAPIGLYNGLDMRKSFRDYLISHKMADRLPPDLQGN